MEHLSSENCLRLYELGYAHNDPALFQEAKVLVNLYFRRLSQEDKSFLDLNPSTLTSIISSDGLVVSSEFVVYRAVWRWVRAQDTSRFPFLGQLMASVRLPLLARCVAVGDKLYVTGGVHTNHTYSDHLHEFNPLRGRWTQLPSMSVPRASHGFLACNQKLFAVGGWRKYEEYPATGECYDLATGSWY